jgi:predicted metallopeptidase
MTEDPMFTDLEERRYLRDEPLEQQARRLMVQHDQLAPLRIEVDDQRLLIAYLYDTRPFNAASEEMRPHTIAHVTRAPELWVTLSGYAAALIVRRAIWQQLDERARDAVMFHELLHLNVTAPGTVTMRYHDLEEFAVVVGVYGSYLPDRRDFLKHWMAWERAQDRV